MGRLFARNDTAALVAFGQICFLMMMASCLAITPSQLAVKRGLSFYGNHLQTIVPYCLGFALCVGLTALGLRRLAPVDAFRTRLRIALGAVLILMSLIPLTPYSVDQIFDYLHTVFAATLFAAAASLGTWLALWVLRSRLAYWALAAQAVSGLFALTAQLGWHDYMIPSQLAFQVSFAVLVVLGLVKRSTLARCE
ncbi:MAG TPA: hypothetical protein VFA97_03910 [Gaiellaceae bacterium]|nr:hypothetical protein [Gaiellaceae bacterium]